MELQTAIEILEYHQAWRLGEKEDMIHEPKKLTEALNVVLSEAKRCSRCNGTYKDKNSKHSAHYISCRCSQCSFIY